MESTDNPKSSADSAHFLQWKTAHVNNERKFIGWIHTSLTMITVGFVVERFHLLAGTGTGDGRSFAVDSLIPLLFFLLGGIILTVSTVEYFRERRRINRGRYENSRLLDTLVATTFVFLAAITVAFLVG